MLLVITAERSFPCRGIDCRPMLVESAGAAQASVPSQFSHSFAEPIRSTEYYCFHNATWTKSAVFVRSYVLRTVPALGHKLHTVLPLFPKQAGACRGAVLESRRLVSAVVQWRDLMGRQSWGRCSGYGTRQAHLQRCRCSITRPDVDVPRML